MEISVLELKERRHELDNEVVFYQNKMHEKGRFIAGLLSFRDGKVFPLKEVEL